MTVYYDPHKPLVPSLAQVGNSSIKSVLKRPEFYIYVLIHVILVSITTSSQEDIVDVDWKASGAMQYFATFFATFYNGHCYTRYEVLNECCMDILCGLQLFVLELTITFKDRSLWKHRLQATRYIIASAYLHFMSLTGGSLSYREWNELVKKGLLSEHEANVLMKYPGPDTLPLLTTWTMTVIADGLEQDCMWTRRSHSTGHIQARLRETLSKVVDAYQMIVQVLALPIPFVYWHLMNIVFALNFLILGVVLSNFNHWVTVIIYIMALFLLMGLREVSNALADPFGVDSVDFPLVQYLDYMFDYNAILLQSFSHPFAYSRIKDAIKTTKPFTERNVRRTIAEALLYDALEQSEDDFKHFWNTDMPLLRLQKDVENEKIKDLRQHLTQTLDFPSDEEEEPDEMEESKARMSDLEMQNKELAYQIKETAHRIECLRAGPVAHPPQMSK
eukprot:NODE_5611_length_1752_cov_8.110769.p1 GENE.NODE_5611_length_1752_cov_8.110769~~NODE_5611_length_1752_cov_8.110769.p1  ORF type:complete len:446 (+),score=119.49 NODE_5611_length_1752_cov_8.110769:341-1678(+)